MGDSRAILKRTLNTLKSELEDLRVSRFYRTKPLYNTEQPDFLNLCISGMFSGTPVELLALCHKLENQEGRERREWKGQRTLDVDIILFGNSLCISPDLTIPHPGLEERAFVLKPLLDLDPHLKNPLTGKKLETILEELQVVQDQGVVPEA